MAKVLFQNPELQDYLFKNDLDNSETSTANAGALAVDKCTSLISSAGAESRTLAAPSALGVGGVQLKIIRMSVKVGNVTLAGTNVLGQGAATATFAAVGDSLVLMNNGSKWVEIGGNVVWA